VDNQNDDSSKVKTHEEIMKLFKDSESIEAKVKNSEEFKKDTIESKAFYPELEPPLQKPEEAIEEQQSTEPTGEIPHKKKEKQKQLFLKRTEKPEIQNERETNWFSFLKKEKNNPPELEPSTIVEQQAQEIKIPRSTFTLQLDNDGNLVGFPIKKPHLEQGKKGWLFSKSKTQSEGVESEEETVKGIKGKLKHVISTLRRKKSEESESSVGISEKITGIFRRKNKE